MEIRHIDWLPAPGVNTQGVVAALVRQAQQPQSSLGTVYSADGVTRYTYDPTGQLVAAQYSACATGSASAVLPDETYTYDANGNRTMPGYVIGEGNRLLSDGTYQYAYDAEGNRTARFIDANANGLLDEGDNTITVYGWDGRNRLASVTTYATFGAATQIVRYRYDTQNRWIGETIDAGGDGTIDHATRFVYDGHQIALQFDKACATGSCATGSASVLTAADLSHRYLWGPAVDQLLSDERTQLDGTGNLATDELLWALGDQLGTVRDLAICDAATGLTSVANHRDFDSFGNLKAQTDAAVDCLIGFTGRPESAITDLRNHVNRWTDPRTANWISEDPMAFLARDTNLFRFVLNNSIQQSDPNGLEFTKSGYNFYGIEFPGMKLSNLGRQSKKIEILGTQHAFELVQVPEDGKIRTTITFSPGTGIDASKVFLVQFARVWWANWKNRPFIAHKEIWEGAKGQNKSFLRGIVDHIVVNPSPVLKGWFVDVDYRNDTTHLPFYMLRRENRGEDRRCFLTDAPTLQSISANQFMEFIVGAYWIDGDGHNNWLGFMRWGVTSENGGWVVRSDNYAMYDPNGMTRAPAGAKAAMDYYIQVEMAKGRKFPTDLFNPKSIEQ